MRGSQCKLPGYENNFSSSGERQGGNLEREISGKVGRAGACRRAAQKPQNWDFQVATKVSGYTGPENSRRP